MATHMIQKMVNILFISTCPAFIFQGRRLRKEMYGLNNDVGMTMEFQYVCYWVLHYNTK